MIRTVHTAARRVLAGVKVEIHQRNMRKNWRRPLVKGFVSR